MRKHAMLWTMVLPLLLTAVASTDRPTAKVRAGRKPLLTLRGHTEAVTCVRYTADGKLLGTASRDKTAVIWDAHSGVKRFTLEGHTSWLRDLSFGPGRLATAGNDRTVRIWDIATGRALATLPGHSGGVFGLAFGPRGDYLTSGGRLDGDAVGELVIRDSHRGKEVRVLRPLEAGVSSLAYSRGGKRLATGLWSGKVVVWETATMSPALTLGEGTSPGPVWSVAFSGDGKRLAAAGWEGSVQVWSLPLGRECKTLKGHGGRIIRVSFSPDNQVLASAEVVTRRTGRGVCEGEIIFWATGTSEEKFTLALPEGEEAYDFCFSPDGSRLATAHDDGTVKVWSVKQLLGQ